MSIREHFPHTGQLKSQFSISTVILVCAALFLGIAHTPALGSEPIDESYRVSVGEDMSVRFSADGHGLYRTPFSVRHKDKEIGLLGFDIAYEGETLDKLIQATRHEKSAGQLVVTHQLTNDAQVVTTVSVERGKRGIGVAINLRSAPGLMTHVLPLGHETKVQRLYFGTGIVAEGVRDPVAINKGGFCSSLAVEFDNGIYEFQHVSQPPRNLQIDPRRNLYAFELKRTFDQNGDVVTGHGEWDRVSDDVTYTHYFTDDFMDGVGFLREKLNVPTSDVTRRLIGMQHINLSFFANSDGRRGHDRQHIRSEGFESVRFCMDLFVRGMTDLFIQGDRSHDNGDLFRLCDRYQALKSIYQQYGIAQIAGSQGFHNNWSRIDAAPFGKEDVCYCPHPELHGGRFHPVTFHGIQTHRDSATFPMIAPHALPNLIRTHQAAVMKAYNIDSVYQDVISGSIGGGYWDSEGRYVKAQQAVKCLREFFQENRKYGPVLTEFAEEAYFGYADAAYPSYVFGAPAMGIEADRWEFFPFKDLLYHDTFVMYGVGRLSTYKTGWAIKADEFVLTDQQRAYGERVRDARSTAILLGHPANMATASVHTGMTSWKGKDTDLTPFMKDYYLHHQFHEKIGLRKAVSFEFAGGNLNRQIVGYEGGTRVWVNRSSENWEVEGYTLPQYGFLVKGDTIEEYSALSKADAEHWVDYVNTPEEIYADSIGKKHDFGRVETDTQVAIQHLANGVVKIVPYPTNKAGTICVRLQQIENGWNYGKTRLKAYNGVGNLLGEAVWKNDSGLRFSPDAVNGAVFYVAHLEAVDPHVRWDIGTDLIEIENWKAQDDNLVQSPGFEPQWFGLHGWMTNPDPNGVTTSLDRAEPHSGEHAFKLTFNGGRTTGYKHRYQWLQVEPGKEYSLSYFIKTEELSQGVGILASNPRGLIHPFYRMSRDLSREREYYEKGTTSWKRVETRFEVDDSFIILAVHTPPGANASGTAWIDDVRVEELE